MTRAFLLALAALACAPRAHAQVTVEVRGGAAMGAYEPTGAGLQSAAGPSFGAALGYALRPGLELFAGFARDEFGCEEELCAEARPTFTRSGAEAGLRVELPARLWLRGGVATQTFGVSEGGSSGSSLGVRLGAGAGFPLGRRISLTPGIEYSRFNTDLDDGDDGVGILTGGVGLRIRF